MKGREYITTTMDFETGPNNKLRAPAPEPFPAELCGDSRYVLAASSVFIWDGWPVIVRDWRRIDEEGANIPRRDFG